MSYMVQVAERPAQATSREKSSLQATSLFYLTDGLGWLPARVQHLLFVSQADVAHAAFAKALTTLLKAPTSQLLDEMQSERHGMHTCCSWGVLW